MRHSVLIISIVITLLSSCSRNNYTARLVEVDSLLSAELNDSAYRVVEAIDEDELMEAALEAGADDMIVNDDSFEILTEPGAFNDVHGALSEAGYEFVEAEVEFVPSMEAAPKTPGDLKALKKMIDILEDNDDIQKVHHNCSVDLEEVE